MERKLKIILCIVAIILIALISFVGVYTKDVVIFKNSLPDYILSSDFEGKRIAGLVCDDGTEEVIYDKDGNKVDSIPEGANEEEYKKEEQPVNSEESLNQENYKKVREILIGRLESLGIEDYKVRVDENTGDVSVELEENSNTDTIVQYLICNGDFKITDANDDTVLLDKNDIKVAKILYSNATANGITVYLDIEFNKEGKEKLKNVSKEYLKVEDSSEETNTEENSGESETKKEVTLTLEGTEMLTTSFDEEITTGKLTISLGSGTEMEDLQSYIEQGNFYAMLINNDDMPISYKIDSSSTVKGNLNENDMYISIGVVVLVTLIVIVYMICRFKTDGFLAGISMIGTIAVLLIFIRYTNTEISLNSLGAMLILVLVNSYLINKMLKTIKLNPSYESTRKATFKTYLDNIEIIIITLIISVVFTFMKYISAYTFGMTLFYGIISIALTNLIFLRTMLLAKHSNN